MTDLVFSREYAESLNAAPELSAEDLRGIGAFVHNAALRDGNEAIGRDFVESIEGVYKLVRVKP